MRVLARPDGQRVAEECECKQTQKLSYALNRCGIPKRYEDATLESYDFRFPGADPSLARAHLIAKRFADDYPAMMAPGRGIMLVGSAGLGKTHLAVGILKFLVLEKRCDGLFCYYQQLLKDIQNSWNSQTSTTELQVLEPVFNAEVLVLDDLGSVKPTDWVWDMVAMVLNTRYNNKLLTIVTTNFDNSPAATLRSTDATPRGEAGAGAGGLQNEKAKALAAGHTLGDRIGDRMYSRLLEMCREVRLQGLDYRERFADEETGLNGHLSGRR